MKRIFSILLITALLLGLMPLMGMGALAEEYATVTSTNGFGVRMREGPSKGYAVLTKLDVGTTVVVLQTGTEWSQIRAGETIGWMMNEFLNFGTTGSTGSTDAPVTGVANATVTSGNGLRVWLRATAGGKRLQLYSPGTAVTVLEHGSKWCHVSIGGNVGYMMTEFLAFEQPPAPGSLTLESISLNYDYPVIGDVMEVSFEPADATVSYSWKVDGVVLGTEPTFAVLNEYAYKRISVTVTGTGAYKGKLTATALADTQISHGIKSVQLSTDTPVVGDVLSAIIQPSSAVVEYTWRVGGVTVSSDATYTVTEADVGKLIQLKVTGVDPYTGAAACSASKEVVSAMEVLDVKLSSYYPLIGETVTASVTPAGAAVNYTWTVDGEVVSHNASYTVQPLQLGKQLKVVVEGVAPYYGTVIDLTERIAQAALTGVSIDTTSPYTRDTLWAYVTPANASADFEWFADGVSLNKYDSHLDVTDAMIGKKISVIATGSGVYSNQVTSAMTAPVVDHTILTGVTLDNNSPVVGDTLTATPSPRNITDAEMDDLTYVWYIDTQVAATHGRTYNVQPSDAGKVIRVKVSGTGIYTGEVYSGYTNPVVGDKEINSVSILNVDTGDNATYTRPEVGHTLVAVVDPAQATVEYVWAEAVSGNVRSTSSSYTLKAIDVDKQIKLTVKGTGNYKGEKTATSAAVLGLKPVVADMDFAAPEAGKIPVNSTMLKDVFEGSIQWLNEDGSPALLEKYGHFLPGKVYVAAVNMKLAPGYTLQGATIGHVAGTYDGTVGNTVYIKFPATSSTQVTDYFISEVPTPVVGGVPVMSFSTEQYSGTVSWGNQVVDGKFASLDTFTAKIKLTANGSYDLSGLNEPNIFHVAGASKTTYDPATQTVTAVFEINRTLTVKADKDAVYLDGFNHVFVTCTLELTNYVDGYSSVKWEVVNPTVDATKIDAYGQLTIGMYETPDRTLTVRATVTLPDGSEYVATKDIQLISGSETDTAIQVEFTEASKTGKRGSNLYFNTVVSNSNQGCTLYAFYSESDYYAFGLNEGYLYLDDTKPQNKVVVKAVSNEDTSVVASVIVDIVDVDIKFVDFTDTIERGYSGYYKAEVAYSTQGCKLYADIDGALTYIGDNEGIVNIGTEVQDDYVTIYAVSIEDSSILISRSVTITDVQSISTLELLDDDVLPADMMEEAGIMTLEAPEAETAEEETLEPEVTEEAPEAETAEEEVDLNAEAGIMTLEAPEAETTEPEVSIEITGTEPEVEVTEEETTEPEITVEEPEVEVTEEETTEPEITVEEPEVEATEEETTEPEITVEEPEVEVTEEETTEPEITVEEPEVEVTEEETTEPEITVEESEVEVTEEETTEPEITVEEPEVEVTEEETTEPEITVEEPEVEATEEEEAPTGVVIEIKDTVTGEIVEGEPVEEEKEEETPTGVVIEIKDTVTGEVVEEQPTEPEVEESEDEPKTNKSDKKSDKTEKSDEEETEELTEEELPDPELDDLEGDKDVGESTAESSIKIRFVEKASTVKRGHTAQFEVEVEGSEQGVRWSVRRSKNADGKKVSTISQDGLLTVSGAETAEKLIVVATSVEDGTVRARWIVTIKNPSKGNGSDDAEEEIETTEEPVIDETEEIVIPELPEEEDIVIEPETEGLTDEQMQMVEEELEAFEQENEVVNFF